MNTSSTGPERYASFVPENAEDVISFLEKTDERSVGFLGGLARHLLREMQNNVSLLNGSLPHVLKIFDGLGREVLVSDFLDNVLIAVKNEAVPISSRDLDGIHDVSILARFSEIPDLLKDKHVLDACKASVKETSHFFASDMQKIYYNRPDLIRNSVDQVLKKVEGPRSVPLVMTLLHTVKKNVQSGAASIIPETLSGIKDYGIYSVLGSLTQVGESKPIVPPIAYKVHGESLTL